MTEQDHIYLLLEKIKVLYSDKYEKILNRFLGKEILLPPHKKMKTEHKVFIYNCDVYEYIAYNINDVNAGGVGLCFEVIHKLCKTDDQTKQLQTGVQLYLSIIQLAQDAKLDTDQQVFGYWMDDLLDKYGEAVGQKLRQPLLNFRKELVSLGEMLVTKYFKINFPNTNIDEFVEAVRKSIETDLSFLEVGVLVLCAFKESYIVEIENFVDDVYWDMDKDDIGFSDIFIPKTEDSYQRVERVRRRYESLMKWENSDKCIFTSAEYIKRARDLYEKRYKWDKSFSNVKPKKRKFCDYCQTYGNIAKSARKLSDDDYMDE